MSYRAVGLVVCLAGFSLAADCVSIWGLTAPVPATNRPPVADAGGNQNVEAGEIVVLDGSGSADVDGDTLIYQWRQTSGPAVSLVNAGTAKAHFEAPDVEKRIRLSFQLAVDDAHGGRSADACNVEVHPEVVVPPVQVDAIAGEDQTVASGSVVTLHGEARGGTGELTYKWLPHPLLGGPPVTLSDDRSATPTFTAPVVDVDTPMTFIFVVADEEKQQDNDQVTITVKAKLTVDAGDNQSVPEGTEVTLIGAVSGGFGQRVVAWQQTAGPNVVLTGAGSAVTTFTAPDVDEATTLTFEFSAVDAAGGSAQDTVDVLVVSSLTAQAGADTTVPPGSQVTLQGVGVAPVGEVSYAWQQTQGESVELQDANTANVTFIAPGGEDDKELVFELTVIDENNDTATDSVTITVHAPRVRFSTTMGEFVILLRTDKAPIGTENFLRYVNEGFYPGLIMHRVIPGFVVQGGGWYPDLSQTLRYAGIPLETNNGLSNQRGWVAYARTSDPNSATSEFFVNLVDNTAEGEAQHDYTNLDYINAQNPGYAVFGRIVEGMDVIDAMAQVETDSYQAPWDPYPTFDDVPVEPIVINTVTVE